MVNIWHSHKEMANIYSVVIMRNVVESNKRNWAVDRITNEIIDRKFVCNDKWEWAYLCDYIYVTENNGCLIRKDNNPQPLFKEMIGDVNVIIPA